MEQTHEERGLCFLTRSSFCYNTGNIVLYLNGINLEKYLKYCIKMLKSALTAAKSNCTIY